jgi:prepilin-type processing-associated H-X9-DG protein
MFSNRIRVAIFAAFIVILLATPAIIADDPPPITKQDLETAENNMKRFGLAFQEYHDANVVLPGNIFAKDGTPLLSWRVAILPYIDEKALFDQFKLDEPWDSKHNKELIAKMPKLYKPIRVKAKGGETFYQVFEGEDTLYRPKKENYTLRALTELNGTSNTCLVIEAGSPVIWTKPTDLPFDKKKPLPKLGGLFDGEFHVVFCDGHVNLFKKNPNDKIMKYIIMPENIIPFDYSNSVVPPPGKS